MISFLFYTNNSNVPITIKIKPIADFLFNFSFKIMYENPIVTNILNLSIGTTTLAGPSWRAL